jgi:hypothetical protein
MATDEIKKIHEKNWNLYSEHFEEAWKEYTPYMFITYVHIAEKFIKKNGPTGLKRHYFRPDDPHFYTCQELAAIGKTLVDANIVPVWY